MRRAPRHQQEVPGAAGQLGVVQPERDRPRQHEERLGAGDVPVRRRGPGARRHGALHQREVAAGLLGDGLERHHVPAGGQQVSLSRRHDASHFPYLARRAAGRKSDMTAITVERAQAARSAQNFVVVVFDGVSMGIMSFAFGVFDMAKHYGVLPDLDLQVVAGEPATAVTAGGLSCYVPYDLDAIQAASLIIIPNWRDPAEPPPDPLLATLRGTWRPRRSCSGSWTTSSRSTSCTPSSRRRSRTRWPIPRSACLPGTGSSWARMGWGRRAWTTTSSWPTSRCTGSPTRAARRSASTARTRGRLAPRSRRPYRSV